ncbi:MAG TPA: acetyltransferase [Acidobacteriota bacterium]|nr:acetyltransferase [Acidobacteriota bacterium]
MKTPVLILGTRLLAIEVMDQITDMPDYEVGGFVENMNRSICRDMLEGFPVYWIDEIEELGKTHVATCALSTTLRKGYVEQAAAMGLRFATLVHPTARVSSRARLGEGCFISAMAAIGTHTTLGRSVFVNRGALIGHHTTIGDYCTIQPGANVAGSIKIGEQSYIGMGAIVLDKHTIGGGCVIGAGAVVTADLPDRVLALGVPARAIKIGIEPK